MTSNNYTNGVDIRDDQNITVSHDIDSAGYGNIWSMPFKDLPNDQKFWNLRQRSHCHMEWRALRRFGGVLRRMIWTGEW